MRQQIFSLIVMSTLALFSGCSTESATTDHSPDTIAIGGSSETYGVLEILTEAYATNTKHIAFEFFPPSQTSGGISGVKNNTIDIGGVSRILSDQERKDDMTYLSLAKVPLVMAVHESVAGITDISADQIKAIYKGDITNWKELGGPDADITLLDFTEDENEKQVLRQAYLGPDLKITADAVVFAEDDELLETAAITEFSIAAVPLEDELATLPLNILSIDGVMPSDQSLQSGRYPMALSLGIVISKAPSPVVEKFTAFVASAEGQQLIETLVN